MADPNSAANPSPNASPNAHSKNADGQQGDSFDSLAQQVTERVWKLMQEELRQTSERRGTRTGNKLKR